MSRVKKNNRPIVIDIFAGCGGLSLGLYQSGWQGLFAIEKNKNAFDTLNHNLIKNKGHFSWPTWLPKSNLDIVEVTNRFEKELCALRGILNMQLDEPAVVSQKHPIVNIHLGVECW